MRPPCAASSLCIFACIALSAAVSNRPRPRPDWFDAITVCHPAWFSRAIASSAPGKGGHSSGDLMYWSLSRLIVPSRSRMTSFMWSGGEPREVGHSVHGLVQRHEQAQAVQAQVRLLRIDHHLVEEGVHRVAQS